MKNMTDLQDMLKQRGLLGDQASGNGIQSASSSSNKELLQRLQNVAQNSGVGALKNLLGQNPNLVAMLSGMNTA